MANLSTFLTQLKRRRVVRGGSLLAKLSYTKPFTIVLLK